MAFLFLLLLAIIWDRLKLFSWVNLFLFFKDITPSLFSRGCNLLTGFEQGALLLFRTPCIHCIRPYIRMLSPSVIYIYFIYFTLIFYSPFFFPSSRCVYSRPTLSHWRFILVRCQMRHSVTLSPHLVSDKFHLHTRPPLYFLLARNQTLASWP